MHLYSKKPVARILNAIFRVIAFIIALLPCALVALLPGATGVPAYLWIPLALACLALLYCFFALRPAWKAVSVSLGGLLAVGWLAVLASQTFAFTPPITGADGQPLPGSMATLEQVDLNGSRQWVSIRAHDTSKPVLIFLSGGPGGSQLSTARFALGGLEEHFVVVNWEQPGAGKSFDAVPRRTLTVDRYIADLRELSDLMRTRFGVAKVYLLGESWGSALAVLAAQRHPQLFHAVIGTGQMVAFLENDLICYNFALDWARERGDTAQVNKLEGQGPPPYYGRDVALKQATYLLDTFNYMNQNPAIADNGFNTFRDLAAPEYGLYDKLNWFRGVLDTLGVVYPQLWDIDFRQQVTELDVPVYMLIGRHDINAPVELAEEYFNLLQAPRKELIWFERSGHNPWVTEPDLFVQTVVERVLGNTA